MAEPVQKNTVSKSRPYKTALFALVFCIWLLLDTFAKRYFDSGQYTLGHVISGPYAGIFQFNLVHNTGGAWGIFSNSTVLLGIFSVVVCIAILVAFFMFKSQLNYLEILGLALLAAGGIGNALDRFFYGYVVDFIQLYFIDFPVFNIADIGVTCGIALVLIGYLISSKSETPNHD